MKPIAVLCSHTAWLKFHKQEYKFSCEEAYTLPAATYYSIISTHKKIYIIDIDVGYVINTF